MFPCLECGKQFAHKRNLVRHHQDKHTPDPPQFSCANCNKQFTRSHDLKRHDRVCNGASSKRKAEDTLSESTKKQKLDEETIAFEVHLHLLYNSAGLTDKNAEDKILHTHKPRVCNTNAIRAFNNRDTRTQEPQFIIIAGMGSEFGLGLEGTELGME